MTAKKEIIYIYGQCEKKGKNSDKLETKKGEWKTPLEKNPSSEKPKIIYKLTFQSFVFIINTPLTFYI